MTPRRSRSAWAGLAWPGLGHLLGGDTVEGLGLGSLVLLLVFAAHQLPALLGQAMHPHALPASGDPWEVAAEVLASPLVPIVAWVATAASLWLTAWDYLRPRARAVPGTDPLADLAASLRRQRAGVVGLYMVLFVVVLALLAPALAPFDPLAIDTGDSLAPPGSAHLMGTDELRRDVLSRVLYGARISLGTGLLAVTLAATLGALAGAAAGYFGGLTDKVIGFVIDVLLSLPRLVLLLAVVGTVRVSGARGLLVVVLVLGLTGWMGIARLVRGQVLSLREAEFVLAGRALGLPAWRIVLRHVLPNTIAPVIVFASLTVGSTILVEAALSFLGIGVSPPTPTWGGLVMGGKDLVRTAWWISTFPGLMIVLTVTGFNLLGDGLRDALDPRTRGGGS